MENPNHIPETKKCEQVLYINSSFDDIFKGFQLLRNDQICCDVKLETEDKKIIHAHKVILAAASPYFYALFTSFAERKSDLVLMRHIDSSALELLVNYIYSGQIVFTANNAQVLLPAANLLQLQKVKEACCHFLLSQLCLSNCIGINALADLHSCRKMITISELYIHQHFPEVICGDEFLSSSSEQVIKLITSDKLTAPSEVKMFESVIRWVNYELGSRKCILPQLMEHIRLALRGRHTGKQKQATSISRDG